MVNLSNENFVIKDGAGIFQMIIRKHEKAEWLKVETLMDSERGSGDLNIMVNFNYEVI